MQETDERQRVADILGGDTAAYAYFLDRYGAEVFALVMRMVHQREEAEELTQDTFVRAYSRLSQWQGRSAFGTWLFRIAYNLAATHLRRHAAAPVLSHADRDLPDVSDEEVDSALADEQRQVRLQEALRLLAPDERTLIALYYYRGLPARDIAYIMDTREANISLRLYRVRRKLYKLIQTHGTEEA